MRTAGIILCGGLSSRMGTPKAWLPFDGEFMLARVVRVVREVAGPVVVVAAPGQKLPPLPAGTVTVRDEEEGRGPLAGFAAGLTALEGAADAVYLSSCDVPFLRAEFVRRMVALLGEPLPLPEGKGELFLPSPLAGEGGGVSPPGEGALSNGTIGVAFPVRIGFPLTRSSDSPPSPARGEGKNNSPPSREGLGAGSSNDILACVSRVNDRLHPLAAAYRVGILPTVRAMLAARQLRMTALFDRVPTRVIGPDELIDADPELISLRNVNTPEEYEAARKSLS